MAIVDVVMPKMGESITDATIIKWYKKEGDKIEDEETLLEVATDKVDSEIPSQVTGVVKNILFKEDDVVDVGEVIATIEIKGELPILVTQKKKVTASSTKKEKQVNKEQAATKKSAKTAAIVSNTERFYSPLVKSIATTEHISKEELDQISGSGAGGRVTKKDLLEFLNQGHLLSKATVLPTEPITKEPDLIPSAINSEGDEIIVMDRMRKLIADHMVQSKKISAHVTSFAEADVTKLFDWRIKVKDTFLAKYGVKLSLTPILIEVVAKALSLHPRINASVEDAKIIVKKNINIGMATALPSGNLIVPVIHNADQFNLNGLAKKVNEKVEKARNNKLDMSDIENGSFTLTNIGTYGSQLGTPIINQPQVAILATGAIKKKPVVIESKLGDAIGIRQMMYLSLSYDHRVVDGFLGGTFLQTVVRLLENFDDTREI